MLPQTEKAILAIVMDRNELSPILFENLTPEYFHDTASIIYRCMIRLREDGMDLRWSTVMDELGEQVPPSFWTFEMMEATKGIHPSGYEPYLKEKIHALKVDRGKRSILSEIEEVARKAELGEDDIEHMGRAVQSMRLIGKPKETPGIEHAISEYQQNIRKMASDITTGFPSFDRRIDGFNYGELVTIMARAGVGKTFVALNIINHLCSRTPFKVALFSLEMPKAAIMERMLQIYFGYSRGEVKSRSLDGSIYLPDFMDRFAKLSIYDKIYSVSEIRKIVEKEGYRAVFVDFLHLVRPEVIGNPYQQISQVVADLKRMAKDVECVAFLLHQLSRQAGSGWTRVEASHARDSGQIEELSDFLFGIWSPGLDPSAPPESENDLSIRLIKNKRGERWTAPCKFEKHIGRILECEKEENYGRDRSESREGSRDFSERSSGSSEGD